MLNKFKVLFILIIFIAVYFLVINPPRHLNQKYYEHYLQNNEYTCSDDEYWSGINEYLIPGYYCFNATDIEIQGTDSSYIAPSYLTVKFEDGYPTFSILLTDDDIIDYDNQLDYIIYMPEQNNLACSLSKAHINDCSSLYQMILAKDFDADGDIAFFYNSLLKFYPQYALDLKFIPSYKF